MRIRKFVSWAVIPLVSVVAAACMRDASQGRIVIHVVDNTEINIVDQHGAQAAAGSVAGFASLAASDATTAATDATTDPTGNGKKGKTMVYLVDAETPKDQLGRVKDDWWGEQADQDDIARFERAEGIYRVVVDVNSDGKVDAVLPDLARPGQEKTITVNDVNLSEDGSYYTIQNDKQIYRHGDTISIGVAGWSAQKRDLTIEIWNVRNGGFLYWTGITHTVEGDISIAEQHVIPNDWPETNDSTGSAYFSYAVTGGEIRARASFVLLKKGSDCDNPNSDGSCPPTEVTGPTDPSIVIAGGADSVTTREVLVTLAAKGAKYYRLSNDSTSIEDVPWAKLKDETGSDVGWLLAEGGDGPRIVFAQFSDSLGNPSDLTSDTVTIDTGAPLVVDLDVNPRAGAAGQVFQISFTVSETPVGGPKITVGGNTASNIVCVGLLCTADYTATGNEPEGTAVVRVEATDSAGNVGTASLDITLDFTAPDTLFVGATPAGTISQNTSSIQFISDEPGVTYECSVDGAAYAACTTPDGVGPLADGAHTFDVRAVDAAGNFDPTPASASWTVDTTPPQLTLVKFPPALTDDTIARFEISPNEPSTYRCMLDDNGGAGFAACTATPVFAGLTEGVHEFQVKGIDLVGNEQTAPTVYTWVVDITPPIISTLAYSLSPTEVDGHTLDKASAGMTIWIAFDVPEALNQNPAVTVAGRNANYVARVVDTYLYSYVVTGGEPEGDATILAIARDNAGNLHQDSLEVTLDFTPPDTFFTGAMPSGTNNVTSTTFQFVGNEGRIFFQCSRDGGVYASCESGAAMTAMTDGPHSFSVRAVDSAGNMDPTPAAATWTVDIQPPQLTLVQFPPALTNNTIAQFGVTTNEPATFKCMVDDNMGFGMGSCIATPVFAGLTEGWHKFFVRATDIFGNSQTSDTVYDWYVDLTPPDILNFSYSLAPSEVNGNPLDRASASMTVNIAFDVTEPLMYQPTVTVAGRMATFVTHTLDTYTFSYAVTGGETEGTNSVVVRVKDDAGNISIQGLELGLDFTPPQTTQISASPSLFTLLVNYSNASYLYSTAEMWADGNTPFECKLDGAAYSFCLNAISYGPLLDGSHTVDIRAIDRAGNRDPSPLHYAWTIDTVPPNPPDPSKIRIVGHPTGTADEAVGDPAAVDTDVSFVYVYADSTLLQLLAKIPANADGSFTQAAIGDDVGDGNELVYIVAVDGAGNLSSAIPKKNRRIPPTVSPVLIKISLVESNDLTNSAGDSLANGKGNPGETIKVTWDNTVNGNNNADIASVSVVLTNINVGPISMSDTGGGMYEATFPSLVAGTFDGSVYAAVTAVDIVGLTSGAVNSASSVAIDVLLPDAPASITGSSDAAKGGTLDLSWSASAATDVQKYVLHRGLYPGPVDVLFGVNAVPTFSAEAPPCTQQRFSVLAIDDAGNESSTPTVGGPVDILVPIPELTAWGGINGMYIYADVKSSFVEKVTIYFDSTSHTSGDPLSAWVGTYADGTPSPISAPVGGTFMQPLTGGTTYYARATVRTKSCEGDPGNIVSADTLGFGAFGLKPGTQLFGGLGYAVAGVDDLLSSDGKEDILTGSPGAANAILVSSGNVTDSIAVPDYWVSMDVFGGGPSLASAGDVNGDGTNDYIVGSPLKSPGSRDLAGIVYVYSGATHAELWHFDGPTSGDQVGYAVASLGADINSDGAPEVIAGGFGCMTYDCSSGAKGTVWVLSGATGAILRTHLGSTAGSFYGVAVAGGEDLDGDGVADYAVGAPGNMGPKPPMGAAYAYSGATGNQIFSYMATSQFEVMGKSVAIGKVRPGDATGKLAIGVPTTDPTYGTTNQTLETIVPYVRFVDVAANSSVGRTSGRAVVSSRFGTAVAWRGDIDGDGINDLLAGDPNNPLSAAFGTGQALILNSDTGVLEYQLAGMQLDGGIGFAMTTLRDYNGDGVDEIVLGSPGALPSGIYNAGRLYVLSTK